MKLTVAFAAGLALAAPALAQNGLFDIGNLVVSQIGDGTTALTSAAAVASVREMSIAGVFTGDNANLPTAVSGFNRRVVTSGSATSEGQLTFATDYKSLCFQGYDAAPGTLTIASSTSAAANRVVASINLAMAIDSGTALTDAYSANNIRSSIIDNGTVYAAGTSSTVGGVRSAPFGAVGPSTLLSGALTNTRVVNMFAGSLYASSSSGTFIGVSLISGGTSTLTINTATSGTGTASPYDFLFTNASTAYVTDDRGTAAGGGLQKWTNSGSGWTLAYILNTGLTAGLRSVTIDPASGTIYAVSADAATKLVSIVDTGAASAFSVLYTSTTNTNLRGVEFVSAPTPGSAALLGLGSLVLVRRRRR